MKKLLFFVLLLSFSCILNAQVVISGTINNASNTKITLNAYTSHLDFKEYILYETSTDSNGNFSATFSILEGQIIKLTILDQYTNLFLSNNDNLILKADYNDLDNTLNYSGVGSYNNNYMAADIKQMFFEKAVMVSKIKEPKIFISKVDSLEKARNDLFKT